MNVVADRFIELAIAEQYRQLTKIEQCEKQECLKYLEERQWKLARLYNFSLMAYETNDHDWHHNVCAEIERLERR